MAEHTNDHDTSWFLTIHEKQENYNFWFFVNQLMSFIQMWKLEIK